MIKPLDELEKIIANVPRNKKLDHLCDLIALALASPNPVKHLYNAVESYKSINGRIRIVNYISASRGIPPASADLILSTMIKNSSYYKFKRNLVR